MKSILNKILAGYPALYLVTPEEQRAEAMLKSVAEQAKFNLHAWSLTVGRVDTANGERFNDADPSEILSAIPGLPEKTIILLRDFHMTLAEKNPIIFRQLKDAILFAKTKNITIVILAPVLELPADLQKLFVVEEFQLPDRDDLRVVLANLCNSAGKLMPTGDLLESILDAAAGMTTNEAEDALALSSVEEGKFCPSVIQREKASVVKKNGLLEIIEAKIKPEDIGGLEVLKEDLLSKRADFSRAAREYGLKSPRGILAVGQPGTGKSLTAQACGSIFGLPTLKLDGSSLFGSLVGQSEQNWKSAFATAKAVSPCVFWLDEADGLFSGAKSSGQTDGGTTNRVVKSILQDLQFNSEGIFFVFTANDIDGFPDAMIDRLDVWGVDLPTYKERISILQIHIKKQRRDPKNYTISDLARHLEGFSGRQIEQVWLKAMSLAFNDGQREPVSADILGAMTKFTPTSVTMASAIEARRSRLQGKATAASLPEEAKYLQPTGRNLATA